MKTLKHKQSGVVLVIGLLMLLVITMVGVTAMSGTSTNERMTANHQFQTLSFQAAESAIHDAFNVPSVTPAMSDQNWRINPPANSYNVDIHGGSTNTIGVVAQANVQFCGEIAPPQSDITISPAGNPMYQVYDIRGSGDVATLGSMETHMRRGGRIAGAVDMNFNPSLCVVNQ